MPGLLRVAWEGCCGWLRPRRGCPRNLIYKIWSCLEGKWLILGVIEVPGWVLWGKGRDVNTMLRGGGERRNGGLTRVRRM